MLHENSHRRLRIWPIAGPRKAEQLDTLDCDNRRFRAFKSLDDTLIEEMGYEPEERDRMTFPGFMRR